MSVYEALALTVAFAALIVKLLNYIDNQHKK
ncbi:MAG: putative holin-like toxin [Oscillospiraceae bacterium]|nr:putative holin-like toxin [Oscillospiraceae bacterium]